MITEILTAIIEGAARCAEAPSRAPGRTLEDVQKAMTDLVIVAGRGRWGWVEVERAQFDRCTNIAAKCSRCGSWAVSSMRDVDTVERYDAFASAVGRLGCYCVQRAPRPMATVTLDDMQALRERKR